MKIFDYESIYIAAHGSPDKMLELFYRGVPGPNFILNPKALVEAFWVSIQHKTEYLGLCSFRSYSEYLATGEVDLSLGQLPPWVPIQVVKDNPLVQLTDNKIIFIKEK